jgi:hypothetical protein
MTVAVMWVDSPRHVRGYVDRYMDRRFNDWHKLTAWWFRDPILRLRRQRGI